MCADRHHFWQLTLHNRAQAERERFERLDASVSGKGAATVYRDKQGRIVDEAELKQRREAERRPKHEAPTWGAGLKQVWHTDIVLFSCLLQSR